MINDILNNILLTEGKREMLDYAKKHNIDNEIVSQILATDPSPSKKYSMTVLRWLVVRENEVRKQRSALNNANLDYYLRVAIHNVLGYFRSYIKKFDKLNGSAFNKDFQTFKDVTEFSSFIIPFPNNYVSKRKYKLISKNPENVKKIFENDKCLIVNVKKFNASCIYGANTKWCITSNEKTFEGYSNQFTIYYILNKTVLHSNKLSKIAALIELDDSGTNDGMNHILVYDATDDLVYSNDPDADIPSDDESNRDGYIEYYMDNYFIRFEKYCRDTLGFDYNEIIVPLPK